jgi:hypothetical protein
MAYTIALVMPRAVLSRYDDATLVVVAGTSGQVGDRASKTYVSALDGEFRAYAAGRVRLVTTALSTRTITVVLRAVTDDQMTSLEAWRGLMLVFRDWTGVVSIGSYTTCTKVPISGAPYSPADVADVALDWQEVSTA